MMKLIKKYEELINYIIVGLFTTIVSVFSYYLLRNIKIGYIESTVLSWVIAVTFAYITNKIFVFKKKCINKKELITEFISFYSYRILSLGFEVIFMWLLVDISNINDRIAKILVQFIILVLNYIFSKILIFKKN